MNLLRFMGTALALSMGMVSHAQTLIPPDHTRQLSLNGTWTVRMEGDNTAYAMRVPGNWNMQGVGALIYPDGSKDPIFTDRHPARVAEYRRQFTIPSSWRGMQVFIAFDGAENGYALKVNGQEIGSFGSAFNRSMFNITKAINPEGDNDLTVTVPQNRMKGWEFDTNDDWVFGGLSRDVTLCAVPPIHFEDITIRTEMRGGGARVSVSTRLSDQQKYGPLTFSSRILDASGRQVAAFERQTSEQLTVDLATCKPWSAESPYLYTLQLELADNGRVIERCENRFGVREVTWRDGVFKVNGRAVKIKGVNHHDESPVNGRAMSEEEMLRDLRMMKAANINAIRASHYPPNPHFMDMCDSLGFYVICEVPFGFGDHHLGKSDYLDVLKQRAWFTVQRDKNRPSVVIWSVGNENPNTANGFATARYVQASDPTRPYVFPQTHKPFNDLLDKMPDSTEMFSAHYPLAGEFKAWSAKARRPIMHTEYAHALGTDMGQLQELVELWYNDPKLSGGCVWEWADQGLLKTDRRLADRFAPTEYVWLDDSTYYDMQGILGTDGIVYPDRTPQTDYYQVRKAYSPVKILGIRPKDDNYEVTLVNRYDFTSLAGVRAHIDLMADARLIDSTELPLDGAPGDTVGFMVARPLDMFDGVCYYYHIRLKDASGREFYEKSLRIGNGFSMSRLSENRPGTAVRRSKTDKREIERWVRDCLRVRVGKKNTICQDINVRRADKEKHRIWAKNLLEISEMTVNSRRNKNFVVKGVFRCDSTHYVDGVINIEVGDDGVWTVDYDLRAHGDGEAVEMGLTMLLNMPSDDTQLAWMGRGPFANYPGKDELSEFGVWKMQGSDLYFPGNRQETEVAMLSDRKHESVVIVPRSSKNICVERDEHGNVMLSHNVHVACPFNKGVWAKGTAQTEGYRMKDGFTLMKLADGYGVRMDEIFGHEGMKTAESGQFARWKRGEGFVPFRASYDQ